MRFDMTVRKIRHFVVVSVKVHGSFLFLCEYWEFLPIHINLYFNYIYMNLRKIFASLVTVTMMVALVPQIASAQTFSDVPSSHTFYNDVEAGVAAGYFSTANSMFNPSMTASRGEMAKMLAVAAGLGDGVSTGHSFTDVPADNVFYPYVMKLANNGIVALNNEFNVELKVTRAELAKMVVGAFGFEEDLTGAPAFSDVASTSDFYTFIHTAKNNGVVNGYTDGTFGPARNVTRGEAAAFMNRALGSEFGEADHLMFTASSETVAVDDVVVLNASIRDAQDRLVRDAEGTITFAAGAGVLEETSVDLAFGAATTTITSEFAIEDLEITATYGNWSETVMVSFNIGDNGLSVYLIDDAGFSESDTYGIITLVDENNVPVNGEQENFIVDVVSGDMIIEDLASTALDGVYLFELSNAGIGATAEKNVIEVEHTTTGRVAQATFEVEDVVMTVRVGNPDISTLQSTPIMIFLNDASGAPIVGEEANIEITVLNSEHGVLNTSATASATTLNPEVLTDRGGYIAEFKADNREANAVLKVRYFGQTPIAVEEVEIAIHPMDIELMIPQDTANTFNGYFDVVVSVKDVNGMPVTNYNTNYFDLDVTTGATYTDPTGDGDWIDAGDWASFAAAGVYSTRVVMAESLIKDSTIEVTIQENQTVNVDTEVTATVAATSPIIDDIYFFEALTSGEFFAVFTVVDSNGSPVTGLTDTDVLFEDSDGTPSTSAEATTFTELAGGMYFAESQNTTLTENDKLIIVDEDIEFITLTDSLIDDAGVYFITSDNSATSSNGDAIASVVSVWLQGTSGVNSGAVAEDPTTFIATSDNSALVTSTSVALATVGPTDVAKYIEFDGSVVEEVETATLTLTTTGGASTATKTYSVSPFEVEVVSLDGNTTFTDTTYGLALVTDRDGKLVDPINEAATTDTADLNTDFVGQPVVTLDINGAVGASEVEFSTFTDGLTGIANANAAFSPDHLAAAATVSPAGMFVIVVDRATTNDDVDEDIEIGVEIYGKDQNTDVLTSTMVNVTLDAWLETESSIARPDADSLNARTADTGAVNLYTLIYNDHGVLSEVDGSAGLDAQTDISEQVIIEGDGDITFDTTENAGVYEANNTFTITPDTIDLNGFGTVTNVVGDYVGVRWITVETGDSEEEAIISIYPANDDSDITELTFNTVYPTANLIMTPMDAMYPDADNDELGVIVTMQDQYGNPMSGLSVGTTSPGVSVEIDGDAITLAETTGVSNTGGDSLGSFYSGTFSTDDEGTLSVVVFYNDDAELIETEVESIFLND